MHRKIIMQVLRCSHWGSIHLFLWRKNPPKRPKMPRYFSNVVEGNFKNLVRDSEGIVFSSVREARKEAVGFARDVVKHGFRESTQRWEVVVTEEIGAQVLTVPLSDIHARKT